MNKEVEALEKINKQLLEALKEAVRSFEDIDRLCDGSLNAFEEDLYKFIESIGKEAEIMLEKLPQVIALAEGDR